MIRVHKTTFCTSKADLDRLFACNRVSAGVWNDCLEIARAYHQQHRKVDRQVRPSKGHERQVSDP